MRLFTCLFWLFACFSVHAQTRSGSVVSIEWQMIHSNGEMTEGRGTGFLLSKSKRIVVTAYHVVPTITPSLKEGFLKVNGIAAKLKCFWEDADLVFLELEGDLAPNVPEFDLDLNPKIGMLYEVKKKYSFSFNNTFPLFGDAEQNMLLEGVFTVNSSVISIAETMKKTPEGIVVVSAQYLITDTATESGFSGGPAINPNGKVIGIVKGAFGGEYGILSSASNIERMKAEPQCNK